MSALNAHGRGDAWTAHNAARAANRGYSPVGALPHAANIRVIKSARHAIPRDSSARVARKAHRVDLSSPVVIRPCIFARHMPHSTRSFRIHRLPYCANPYMSAACQSLLELSRTPLAKHRSSFCALRLPKHRLSFRVLRLPNIARAFAHSDCQTSLVLSRTQSANHRSSFRAL